MSETQGPVDVQPMRSAGAMLRAARQAQGLHLAALATLLKINPRKLDALENDRYDELQGPTFVRAQAQAACRALKIDPAPVLALLPSIGQHALDSVNGGLNEPFRQHGTRRDALELPAISRGVVLAVLLLLGAATAMWFLPAGWQVGRVWADIRGVTSSTPVTAVPSAAPVVPVASQTDSQQTPSGDGVALPAETAAPLAGVAQAAPAVEAGSLLRVRAVSESWVDVTDGSGQSLISRTLHPGENVDLDGALPLRVKIGNAVGTELSFRGQPLDLSSQTRDNVARLELK
jgi:cytoskeleton protein RodZ